MAVFTESNFSVGKKLKYQIVINIRVFFLAFAREKYLIFLNVSKIKLP